MKPAAILLAGGASRRMGRPKQLLEFGGEKLLDRMIALFTPHCDPVIAALGHRAEEIRGQLSRAREATIAVNPDPDRGQLSTLQCALMLVDRAAPGVLFTPADYPLLRSETVERLVLRFERREAREWILVPRHEGRRGHPVCVASPLIAELLELEPTARAGDVLRRHPERTAYLDVDDPGILRDLDSPADYEALRTGAPHA